MNVLVADDTSVGGKIAAALLAKLGHRAHVVVGLSAAREQLARDTYDVVVAAAPLAHDGDLEPMRALVSAERRLVVITEPPSAAAWSRARELGVDAWVERPLRRNALDSIFSGFVADAPEIDSTSFSRLRALSADDDELRTLVEGHIENARALVAEMRRAHAEADVATLTRAAHSLKGTAAMFGARRVVSASADLEARAPDLAAAAALVDRVQTEAESAARALSREVARPGP